MAVILAWESRTPQLRTLAPRLHGDRLRGSDVGMNILRVQYHRKQVSSRAVWLLVVVHSMIEHESRITIRNRLYARNKMGEDAERVSTQVRY